jgi:hypothetical protein
MPSKLPKPRIGRIYDTPWGPKASVTSIIEATAPVSERAALEKWAEKQKKRGKPTSAKDAQERGTAVHALRVLYLEAKERGDSTDIMDLIALLKIADKGADFIQEVYDLFIQLVPYYDNYGDIFWLEKPTAHLLRIEPGAKKYLSKDENGEERGFLSHPDFAYAGCPDDIVVLNYKGEPTITLNDLKTSKRAYRRDRPQRPMNGVYADAKKELTLITNALQEAKEKEGIGFFTEEELEAATALHAGKAMKEVKAYREASAGHHSFKKCCMQIAAYRPLAEACLGIKIPKLAITVTSPGRKQFFQLSPREMVTAEVEWNKRLEQFIGEYSDGLQSFARTTTTS